MSDERMDMAKRTRATVDPAPVDTLRARLEAKTAEIKRLRGLLAIARAALGTSSAVLLERWHPFALEAEDALRRSDADARDGEREGMVVAVWNVVARLYVSRPDDEYLPAMLAARLPWDSYSGHIRVHGVDVLYGAAPFPEGAAAEAIATLAPLRTP
jgi:hypothetical protein